MKTTKNELKAALYGSLQDNTIPRYAMNTVRVEADKLISSDGRFIIDIERVYKEENPETFEPFMIPVKDVKAILKLCPNGKRDCDIEFFRYKSFEAPGVMDVKANGASYKFEVAGGHFPPQLIELYQAVKSLISESE